ncbi:MAG: MFS transporter, partial [Bdellovibrionaceae bacterium]|nr:MFS transporter [Pseudobdellovibrionaceae bacterium]
GALNDNIFKNAFVLLLTYKSVELWNLNSGLLVALAGLVFIFPFFIFSATAGQIADKYPKALVIKLTKVAEVLIMSTAAYGFYSNSYQYLFIALFLMGAQSAFFGPVKYGILPFVAKGGALVKVNSLITSSTFLAILIGTVLGGVFISAENTWYIVLALLTAAVVGLISSLNIKTVETETEQYKVDYTFFKATIKTLKLSLKSKDIFFTILGASWLWFMGAAILSILPILCKQILGVNAGVGTFFLSLFTLGMGVGAIVVKYTSSYKVEIGVVPIAAFFLSIFLLDLSYVSYIFIIPDSESLMSFSVFFMQKYSIRAAMDVFLLSVCAAGIIIPQTTYIQEVCDKKSISRIISANNIWNALFMVAAAVLVMLLNPFGIPITLLVFAGLNFLAAILLYWFKPAHCIRFMINILVRLIYKIELVNFDKLPQKGPYILASNHISFADPLCVGGMVKETVCYVMDWSYYYKFPKFYKQANTIPIATHRESASVLKEAFALIQKRLEEGAILGIFPEGGVSRTGQLKPFKSGVQRLVDAHKVPVVLCAIDGLWGSIFSFTSGKVFWKWPTSFRRKVTLTISDIIPPEKYNAIECEQFFKNTVKDYQSN